MGLSRAELRVPWRGAVRPYCPFRALIPVSPRPFWHESGTAWGGVLDVLLASDDRGTFVSGP